MEYRRAKTPGATYFFTLVTHHRCHILCELENINLLREAFQKKQSRGIFFSTNIEPLGKRIHNPFL